MSARILQLSSSHGGVPKLPMLEAEVTALGIAGDAHDDKENHGGPERALCLWAIERIAAIAAEGHALAAGAAGENITTQGLDWDLVVPGVRLQLGASVLVEVTRYTTPCKTNKRWFLNGDFNRMHQELFPGFSRVYARVLEPGVLHPGDAIELIR
ncbi:MAG TPA: MOSC domain-containing protein [Tepidiformaceae bacterium]|nr:MOSC domain-containing protein [Tepidiformaceae bacterium]